MEKNEREHAERSRAEQCPLSDWIAAANETGKEPGQRSDRTRRSAPPAPPPASGRRRSIVAIVCNSMRLKTTATTPANAPRTKKSGRIATPGAASGRLVEVGGIAKHRAGDGDCAGRGAERGDRDPQFEPPHQFLEHEDGAGDEHVERGGEARPAPAASNTRQ